MYYNWHSRAMFNAPPMCKPSPSLSQVYLIHITSSLWAAQRSLSSPYTLYRWHAGVLKPPKSKWWVEGSKEGGGDRGSIPPASHTFISRLLPFSGLLPSPVNWQSRNTSSPHLFCNLTAWYRNKTQTAVTNICLNCITFINLTFRILQHTSSEWLLFSYR